jgi:hypothetical protein
MSEEIIWGKALSCNWTVDVEQKLANDMVLCGRFLANKRITNNLYDAWKVLSELCPCVGSEPANSQERGSLNRLVRNYRNSMRSNGMSETTWDQNTAETEISNDPEIANYLVPKCGGTVPSGGFPTGSPPMGCI